LLDEINLLKRRQDEIRTERLGVLKDLKNARRRKNRLVRKARALSTNDLEAVIVLREETAAARAKAKAKAPSVTVRARAGSSGDP